MQTSLIIKNLIKHENKFNRKVFHNRENSEKRFSEFLYFMKDFKKKSYTFLGSLHNETNVKYAFHEMFWKKYFTVYPRLKERYWAVAVTRVSLVLHSCRTRVASIALVLLVSYPCRSCLALVLKVRLDHLLTLSWRRPLSVHMITASVMKELRGYEKLSYY